jgi:hypothetical protein
MVTIYLTNNDSLPVNGLDVQLTSVGLKVMAEKKWPNFLYPNSSISGQYVLQPMYLGTHDISLSVTYFTNDTMTNPPTIKQSTSEVSLGNVVIQADWGLWSSAWNGVSTTLLGTFFGFVITKVSDYFTSRRAKQEMMEERLEKTKACLLEWLEVNEKKVEDKIEPEMGLTWDELIKGGLYHHIPNSDNLRNLVREIYLDLVEYHEKPKDRPTLSGPLLSKIQNALTVTREWVQS